MSKRTRAFVNGNTIVTNAITELKGSKVGVLTLQDSAIFADLDEVIEETSTTIIATQPTSNSFTKLYS